MSRTLEQISKDLSKLEKELNDRYIGKHFCKESFDPVKSKTITTIVKFEILGIRHLRVETNVLKFVDYSNKYYAENGSYFAQMELKDDHLADYLNKLGDEVPDNYYEAHKESFKNFMTEMLDLE